MTRIDRSALVSFSAAQMYDLVNDIESYPEFMHGCVAASVISRDGNELVGSLTLSKAGLKHTFTTRNKLVRNREMSMELVEGAFRHFNACWRFKPLTETACKVTLEMDFAFVGGVMDFALEKLFRGTANALVDEVVERAQVIYGQ
ncbi:MAG: type II toxin-antitoxin system RatA family toxin [Pseudohongiellaceae bacterium]